MPRPCKVLLLASTLTAVAIFVTACGTERVKVSKSDASLYRGAVLFSQRCAGCHTLSYAGTHGSATNPRTAEVTNGPNLDQRCERPVTRVLYAIENGGFSGAIMPQNVVVGQDARDVAMFVSKYAGSQAAKTPGVTPCHSLPIGTLPPLPSPTATTATAASTTTTTTASTAAKKATAAGHAKAKAKAKAAQKKK